MPTTVEIIARRGGSNGRQRVYAVDDAASETAAMSAVLAHLTTELGPAAILDGLPLQGLDYDESPRQGLYHVVASWGVGAGSTPPPPPETNSFAITFDFAATPQKILLPRNPILVYDKDGEVTAPASKPQLIGDPGDGQPADGVDVFEPMLSFSVTAYKPANFVDGTYLNLLLSLVGRVNSDTWREFAPGELLSTGVSGARRSIKEDWELQYKFSGRPNQTSLEFGDITVPLKRGWETIWPQGSITFDDDSGRMVYRVNRICVTNPLLTNAFALFGVD